MSKTKIFLNLLFTGSCLVVLWRGVLFAQQDNLEVKGTLKCDSLTIQGGTSDPSSPVKGTLFYRSDKKKFYIFDGENWQEIGAGGSDRTVASQIVGTTSSKYGSDKPCDGTSDQEEIEAATDALGDNKGAVYLLEGEYVIDDEIDFYSTPASESPTGTTIYHKNKSLIGQGAGSVLKLKDDAGSVKIIHHVNDNTLFQNFRIDGNRNNQTECACGFWSFSSYYWDGGTNYLLNNIWFENIMSAHSVVYLAENAIFTENFIKDISSGCGYGATLVGCQCGKFIVADNIMVNNNATGVYDYDSSSKAIFSSNIFDNVSGQILAFGFYGGIFLGNLAYQSDHIYPTSGSGVIASNIHIDAPSYTIIIKVPNSLINNNLLEEASGARGAYYDKPQGHHLLIFGNLINEVKESGSPPRQRGIAIGGVYNEGYSAFNLISSNLIYDSNPTSDSIGIRVGYCHSDGTPLSLPEGCYLVGNFVVAGFNTIIEDAGTNTRYTDKLKITLQEGEYTHTGNTISLSGPASYLRLNPSNNIIVNRIEKSDHTLNFSPGDILILENESNKKVTMNETGNLRLHANSVDLFQNDTLALIWDGNYWVEIAHSNNN